MQIPNVIVERRTHRVDAADNEGVNEFGDPKLVTSATAVKTVMTESKYVTVDRVLCLSCILCTL